MFSPLDSNHSSDQKSRILQVKSMFGSSELDEDSIKYFAKNDFYLAGNLSGLEEQIYTCIRLLETLTSPFWNRLRRLLARAQHAQPAQERIPWTDVYGSTLPSKVC